jgi:hypothetical protein
MSRKVVRLVLLAAFAASALALAGGTVAFADPVGPGPTPVAMAGDVVGPGV